MPITSSSAAPSLCDAHRLQVDHRVNGDIDKATFSLSNKPYAPKMIEAIFISSENGSPPLEVSEVELVAGKAIIGDRNFNRDRWPGQSITLIE